MIPVAMIILTKSLHKKAKMIQITEYLIYPVQNADLQISYIGFQACFCPCIYFRYLVMTSRRMTLFKV